ncbi:DEAD/DEAH box helicase [Sphingomonas sp.]|uniref:DEAD/DEAH box helicase n=1 Tax=Sphingomonas sp. TaxID=28214 RepID=UPI0035BC6898
MTTPRDPDQLLALIAEGILEASDDEIIATAQAHGVDVTALERKVREIIATRVTAVQASPQPNFAIGATVALRSDPARIGVITGVVPSNRETRLSVFIDGRLETWYLSQVAAADLTPGAVHATLDEFSARLTALQLSEPSIANLYSLQAGRIDFIPYQFRPVLKFVRADRPRMLVADEVGVGKTIEAGLLLRELQARRPLRSVLIVCSKALVVEEKWHREMRRFDEEFVTLASDDLRYCLDQTDIEGEWPDRFSRAILPFSLVNDNLLQGFGQRGGGRGPGLSTLETPPRFDLLIVDEAHNARNSDTSLHQGLRLLADNAEAVVLITATPVQLGTGDLFSLLNLLRPDLVIDRPTFERMAEPNEAINAAIAAIRGAVEGWQDAARGYFLEAAATDWGRAMLAPSPEFRNLLTATAAAETDDDRVRLIRPAEGLHSFASMISRTRRRDIGNFTSRKARTIEVPFTPEQRAIHDDLLSLQRAIYLRTHGAAPLGFLMTTIRRQAASSLHGLLPFLESILSRRLTDLELVEIGGDPLETETAVDSIRAEIAAIVERARALPADDPKLARLLEIISQKADMPNRRLLLFSSFRHTLAYVEAALRANGVRVGLIHGGVADEDRRSLRKAFALPPENPHAIDVLLSSEVGSEGLDFQFCDALVNYDIPWNPMRIEQRIGRIDRYGQASQTIAIYNFVTPGTVDFDIFDRCLLRIGVFERAIGGGEAILGEIAGALQAVADDFTLTDEERGARLQQLADNEIRQVIEADALEEREAELFGVRIERNRIDDEIAQASSRWLEPSALERLVGLHLERELEVARNPISGQGPVKSLRLSADARRRLVPARGRGTRLNLAEREWENWLRGDQQTLALTFDRDTANADRGLAFITPVHPLTQAAARSFARDEEIQVTLKVTDPTLPVGDHAFAIYQWQMRGLREDAMLVSVVEDPIVSAAFTDIFATAQDASYVGLPGAAVIEGLEGWHHELWTRRRAAHIAEAGEIARFRRDSLEASHNARIAILEEQLRSVTEDRIRRMRLGQLARASADHREALDNLAAAERRADILPRRVAAGILRVEH